MVRHPRRRFLQLCGVAAGAALAGCSDDGAGETATPTAASTTEAGATDTVTETATATDSQSSAIVWSSDSLSGRVQALQLPRARPTDEPTGPLYASIENGDLARVSPADGRIEWSISPAGVEARLPSLTPAGDVVYVVSETYTDDRVANHLEAVDASTGDVRWHFADRYSLEVVGVLEDLVVVAGEYFAKHPEEVGPNQSAHGDGRLFGLDPDSGDVRWTADVPGLDGANAVSHGVYAMDLHDADPPRSSLRAFDRDGTERWSVAVDTHYPRAPLAAEGLLAFGTATGESPNETTLARYDPDDGSVLWTGGEWEHGPLEVSLLDGVLHAGVNPCIAFDPDGTEQYRVPRFGITDARWTSDAVYDDGGTQLTAIDRSAGEVRWRHRPESYEYIHRRALLADYVAVDQGIGDHRTVYLLDTASGEVAERFNTEGEYDAMAGAGATLFAGVGNEVVAYDVTSEEL